MKTLLAAVLLSVVSLAHAASARMDAGGLTVILSADPCTEAKVLSFIQDQYHGMFRKADVIYQGKALKACWMALPDRRSVLVADETGDYGAVPIALFKPVTAM